MSSESKENIGCIAGLIAILGFFGYPTLKSFFETTPSISTEKIEKRVIPKKKVNTFLLHHDSSLMAKWDMKIYNKGIQNDVVSYTFLADGNGLWREENIRYANTDSCFYVIEVPFKWKTSSENGITKIERKLGIADLIVFNKYGDPNSFDEKAIANQRITVLTKFGKIQEYTIQGKNLFIEEEYVEPGIFWNTYSRGKFIKNEIPAK